MFKGLLTLGATGHLQTHSDQPDQLSGKSPSIRWRPVKLGGGGQTTNYFVIFIDMFGSSSRNVNLFINIYVPYPCHFYQGLSLALRLHDQFQASFILLMVVGTGQPLTILSILL